MDSLSSDDASKVEPESASLQLCCSAVNQARLQYSPPGNIRCISSQPCITTANSRCRGAGQDSNSFFTPSPTAGGKSNRRRLLSNSACIPAAMQLRILHSSWLWPGESTAKESWISTVSQAERHTGRGQHPTEFESPIPNNGVSSARPAHPNRHLGSGFPVKPFSKTWVGVPRH